MSTREGPHVLEWEAGGPVEFAFTFESVGQILRHLRANVRNCTTGMAFRRYAVKVDHYQLGEA